MQGGNKQLQVLPSAATDWPLFAVLSFSVWLCCWCCRQYTASYADSCTFEAVEAGYRRDWPGQ